MTSQNEEAYNSNFPEPIDVNSLGGEAGAAIEVVLGLERSPCGTHEFIIKKDDIYGYGHSDGIEDDNGRKWWLTIKCDECNYDYSHKHWKNML
jgi:hypothetical protein